MTHELAIKLRNTLHTLFTLHEPQVYFVAIGKTYPALEDDSWSLYLYGRYECSNFLIDLSQLAKALDDLVCDFQCSFDRYDAGTTEPDIRNCIKIY